MSLFNLTLRCMFQFSCLEVCSCLLRVSHLLCLLRTHLRVFLLKCVCVIVLVQSHMLATNALQNLNHCACHFTNSQTLLEKGCLRTICMMGSWIFFLDMARPRYILDVLSQITASNSAKVATEVDIDFEPT